MSPRASIPKSPCNASAGCRKKEGVPVLESVAEIFRPTMPDLPIPVTATRPWHAKRRSTARSNEASRRESTSLMACDSILRTRRAVSRLMAATSDQRSVTSDQRSVRNNVCERRFARGERSLWAPLADEGGKLFEAGEKGGEL